MSKSKSLSPGLNDSLNVIGTHVTWSCVMPSCSAIAYATALSKPSPLAGLPVPLFGCAFHSPYVPVPPNHGWNAGLSVPIVSVPAVRRFKLSGAHGSGDVPVAPVAGDVAPVGPLAPAPSSFEHATPITANAIRPIRNFRIAEPPRSPAEMVGRRRPGPSAEPSTAPYFRGSQLK